MAKIFSDERFIFGSQYYRAPSPPPEDWERDLERMADLGFNMVKYWLQWRWNHPEPDRFYFEDIDRLMDLAEKAGLQVMLNTIVDTAPAWIYREYADASMVTLDGRKIGPQTQPHRQIGGLGVCLNHAQAMEHLFEFLRASIERYSDHPALAVWNVGSEPELTQSMSEMRLYADDASKMGDMLCYCPRCEEAFKGWLEAKYGSIDALNEAWTRNYRNFDEVELPKTRNTFNDVVDWRMFFVDVLGANVRRRFEIAREVDRGRHPLMCHHVFIQGFPVTSTANDPWNVGQTGDLHGFTQMDDPMMHDILRSCARGKPVISAEMLMLMGYTLDLHKEIDEHDIKRHIFTGIAANLKGFIFWQYRPEMLGREAPAWGLTHLDGSSTPWLESFAEVGWALQDHTDFLHRAKPKKAGIAILYSPQNQIFAWSSTGNEKTATDSLLGIHRALYERSHVMDFIHPTEFSEPVMSQYQVIILPFPYYLSRHMAAALTKWVEAGGTLIAEAYAGGWDVERDRHHSIVPGYGLHEVFGVRQRNAVPSSGNATAPAGGNAVPAGEKDEPGDLVKLSLVDGVPGMPARLDALGAILKETFFVERAEVLAKYEDGEAAITISEYGDGRAVAIGTYLGLPFARGRAANNGRFLNAILDFAVDLETPSVDGFERIRIDTLDDGEGKHLLILQNLESRHVTPAFNLSGADLPSRWAELFSGEMLLPQSDKNRTGFTVSLSPHEVKVYRG